MEATSLNGQLIEPGTFIAYPVRFSSSMDVKIGKVLEIREKKRSIWDETASPQILVISADRDYTGTWKKQARACWIDALERVVVLDRVPDEVKELLNVA
jgi:hypothetical protein